MRLASVLLLLASACATVAPARAFVTDADHHQLGLTPGQVALWEDGMRTDGSRGTYEWWYLDGHLDDGSTLVLVFLTKPFTAPGDPLRPFITMDLTRPDGTKVERSWPFEPAQFSAAKERCDVRIGENRFEGDLHHYTVHVKNAELEADLELDGTLPAWRPGTGVLGFGAESEKYFAWLPAVPTGTLRGALSLNGQRVQVSGTGYHDHNWGNAPLLDLIHDWYWGRAQVGPYSVIASYITASERYGQATFPIFMLAKDGAVLADDARQVRFRQSEVQVDQHTRKPFGQRLVYDFEREGQHWRVTFERKQDLVRMRFVDLLHGVKGFVARLVGFDAAYSRFGGQVTVEQLDGERVVERTTNEAAVWEQMYLGKSPL